MGCPRASRTRCSSSRTDDHHQPQPQPQPSQTRQLLFRSLLLLSLSMRLMTTTTTTTTTQRETAETERERAPVFMPLAYAMSVACSAAPSPSLLLSAPRTLRTPSSPPLLAPAPARLAIAILTTRCCYCGRVWPRSIASPSSPAACPLLWTSAPRACRTSCCRMSHSCSYCRTRGATRSTRTRQRLTLQCCPPRRGRLSSPRPPLRSHANPTPTP